jgi:arylsulfatase A-like enzyme
VEIAADPNRPGGRPVVPRRRVTLARIETPWLLTILRQAASWSVTGMVVVLALAVTVDATLLLSAGATLRVTLGTVLFTAGLGGLLAVPMALPFSALATVARHLDVAGRRPIAALALVFVLSAATAWIVGVRPTVEQLERSVPIVLFFAVPATTLAAAARGRRQLPRLLAALVLGGAALALDIHEPKALHREVHYLACLFTCLAGLTVFRPVQRRLASWPSRRLFGTLAGGLLVASLCITVAVALAPEWRGASAAQSRYAGRFISVARALTDLDADGFSPIAWGGDCDDLDGHRHPLMTDRHGAGDLNCNGIDPPLAPTDSQRGLAPPFGDPELPPGTAKVVLLVTIDCLRADALEAMPALTARARTGLVFDRMYAGATRTVGSMPLISTGGGKIAVTDRLRAAGIDSTVVLGVNYPALEQEITSGANTVIVDHDRLSISAAEVTAHTVAHLRKAASSPGRAFLWAHYFDAHSPDSRGLPPSTAEELRQARAHYLRGLGEIDGKLEELLRSLAQLGLEDRTLVIVTSDHGEAFGEHDVVYHVITGYEVVTRVPAVLFAPGERPGHYRELASHRDIYPTVLGAFGLIGQDPSAERFGRSWLRLREAGRPLHEFVTIRSHRSTIGNVASYPMLALVSGRHKLIKPLAETDYYELYDLEADPAERNDLSWVMPDLRRALTQRLELFRDIDQWHGSAD